MDKTGVAGFRTAFDETWGYISRNVNGKQNKP